MTTVPTTLKKEVTLDDVAQAELNRRLTLNSSKVESEIKRLERESKALVDFIVPSRKMIFSRNTGVKDAVMLTFDDGSKPNWLSLSRNALSQFGARYNIPSKYLSALNEGSSWEKELLAHTCNKFADNNQKTFLVREVEGVARAMVTQHYKRLDTMQIAGSFIDTAIGKNCVISDAFTGEERSFIEVLYPHLVSVPTKNNGIVKVAFGMQFSTSDYGCGALDLKGFIIQGICFNGLTIETRIREIHLGRKLPEQIEFSLDTYKKDSEATASAVKDMTSNLLSEETIYNYGKRIQDASSTEVDITKEIKVLPKVGMLKGEIESLQEKLNNNKKEDGLQGESTLWRLCQGISSVARDSETETRKRELMDISGKLFMRVGNGH